MDGIIGLAAVPAIVAIVALYIVFFLTRAFWTWYFKIDEIVEVLNGIEQHLSRMAPPDESEGKEPDEPESQLTQIIKSFRRKKAD